MLHQSGLPKFLWGEAVLHANWLKNRTSTRTLDHMTPYEALTGNKPNLSNLHEWGTKVWVHDDTNSKRIYWPGRRTISVERNIKFDENDILIPAVDDMPLEGEIGPEVVNQPVENVNDNAKQEAPFVPSQPPSREPSPIPERPKAHTKTVVLLATQFLLDCKPATMLELWGSTGRTWRLEG